MNFATRHDVKFYADRHPTLVIIRRHLLLEQNVKKKKRFKISVRRVGLERLKKSERKRQAKETMPLKRHDRWQYSAQGLFLFPCCCVLL